MPKEDVLVTHLYQAIATEFGIVIHTDDPERLRQKLYAKRRELNDPALDCLSFQVSPNNPTEHLWLTRRK